MTVSAHVSMPATVGLRCECRGNGFGSVCDISSILTQWFAGSSAFESRIHVG